MPPVQDRKQETSAEVSRGFKAKLGTSNIVSYEDLLIAQYIDDIKKGPDVGNRSESSPYLGKYTTLEEGLTRHGLRGQSAKKDRPVSAYADTGKKGRPCSAAYGDSRKDIKGGRSLSAYGERSRTQIYSGEHSRSRPYSAAPSQSKPKIDAKFIADPDLWDPATPRDENRSVRRTRSAQYGSKKVQLRTDSAKKSYSTLIDHEIYMSRRPKKKKPLYKRQPYVIRCTAYKNGDRDICAQMAAPNIKLLLESCTSKLQLNGAARRIFLEDGIEIFETDEIPKDGEIYVSNGEAFKNPYKPIIERHAQREQLQWTMAGLTLPAKPASKKKSKFLLSKRFKNMVTVNTRRVMIYLNGQHTNCHEVISDLKSMDDFLAAATNKLGLRSHARIVYDWSGTEITLLDQIQALDPCLQEVGTPVLGPVWISCGGGFSPSGACRFLEGIISHLRKNIRESKYNKSQMELARDEKTEEVELMEMLSMSEEELNKDILAQKQEINNMTQTLKKMKAIHEEVSEEAKVEEETGHSYTLQHIKEIDASHSAVGGMGLKLKVYNNGHYDKPAIVYFNARQASRGIKDSKLVFERLLDQCASRLVAPSSQGTKFARRLFDANGAEIKDIDNLQTEQELFLSMGEAFKSPYVLCLQANFEQVRGVEMQYPPETPQRQTAVFHANAVFLETAKTEWEGTVGFPDDYQWTSCNEKTDTLLIEEITQSKELDINTHWLVHKDKDKRDMILYPSLVVSDKKKKGSNELWPAESQMWVLSKGGYISCRAIPFLVMAVLDTRVDCKTKGKSSTRVTGYAVGLQKKQEGNPAQQWRFTKDGAIYSVSQPELILTFLGARYSHLEEEMIVNEVEGVPNGFIPHLAVCEKISGKDSSLQRFAMKQERFDNLGQWKFNDRDVITNPEFNKLAYSWPVSTDNTMNEQFDWPMEFYFVAMAPLLQKAKKDSSGHTPLRLAVMKNGEADSRYCCSVVGPDLTNMIRDLSKQAGKKSSHHHHHHGSPSQKQPIAGSKPNAWTADPDQDDSVHDFPLHCDDLTFRELEFRLFLERCTGALNLPFAARRLFDAEGREHHTLKELSRNELVYATCGEVWIDPKISKAESQRRLLLTNLSSDIAQIRQFCALRDTEGYVCEVEGAAVPNAKVILNHCPEMQDKIETETAEKKAKEREVTHALIESDLLQDNTTAHERSHQKMEDKGDKLKWPWERLANDELSDIQESPRRDSSPQRMKTGSTKAARNVQKFVYDDDGYLCCQVDCNMVLSVTSNSEGQQLEVTLAKRKVDELTQMWIIKPNGYIHTRAQRDMVLTVAMPTNSRRDEEGLTLNYVGCQVVVQKKRSSQFGSANQKWNLDQETGYISVFHTNHLDVEISAANKANVCTYAVTKEELDQPGYIVSLPTKNGIKQVEVVVCTSCARAMRGKFKLTRIPESYDFSCAMGTSQHRELKQIGSFCCLNGKVDLSTFEAINTLDEWETKYNKLYEEHSVRSIAKEISASNTPQSVKIYAYKNGENRSKGGQLIVGSSIIGLLDQCTYRLAMTNAARRLYTRDGTVIVDIEDLVAWAVEHYTANMQRKSRRPSVDIGGTAPDSSPQTGSTAELAQYLTLQVETAADGDSYQPVNEEPLDAEFALLEVTTGCDNHIALINNNGTEAIVVYEFIIGRASESAIIIHPSADASKEKGDSYDDLIVNKYPLVEPSGEAVEKYWLSWSQSTLRMGRGDVKDEQQFMVATDTEERSVNHIVVASQGADTIWTFRIPVDYTGSAPNSHGTGPTEINKLMNKVELNDEEDTGSKIDDLSENAAANSRRLSRPKTAVATKIEPPPVAVILRYPIEVWASPGEKFVKPEKVAADQKDMRHYRKLVADINFSLQKEKHKLRQLQGRRLTAQQPGYYESTASSVNPVVKRNHWQELTFGETVAHHEVHQLQTQQMAVQTKQRSSAVRPVANRLYTQPSMKRVLAYVNGEPISRAQYIWGDDHEQILQNATTRLNLRKAAKAIYALSGQQIKFEDLEKDQIICVSTGGLFQRPKDMQQEVEIRANWTRARKELGPDATNITVHAQLNPDIDVDPFGPPSLASHSERRTSK